MKDRKGGTVQAGGTLTESFEGNEGSKEMLRGIRLITRGKMKHDCASGNAQEGGQGGIRRNGKNEGEQNVYGFAQSGNCLRKPARAVAPTVGKEGVKAQGNRCAG